MEDDSPYDISVSDDADAHSCRRVKCVERAVVAVLTAHQCPSARVSVALLDDARIAELNRRYLDHPGPTDVLSFNLTGPESDVALEGEIVVSRETAARVAARRGHATEAEILLYVVHGALHLLGFDDRTDRDAATMHAEEDRILTALGFGAIYAGVRR